jgi:hypothetical protein
MPGWPRDQVNKDSGIISQIHIPPEIMQYEVELICGCVTLLWHSGNTGLAMLEIRNEV